MPAGRLHSRLKKETCSSVETGVVITRLPSPRAVAASSRFSVARATEIISRVASDLVQARMRVAFSRKDVSCL